MTDFENYEEFYEDLPDDLKTPENRSKTLPGEDLGYSDTSYNFCFVLYPDSKSYKYMDVLKTVQENYYSHRISNYAYILHDQDVVVDTDVSSGRYPASQLGQSRKAHYHLLINFKSQKSYRSVLKLLGLYGIYSLDDGSIGLRYPFYSKTAIVHNFRNYLKYMLHRTPDSISKHQYSSDEMITSDPDLMEKIVSDSIVIDDVALFKDIVHFIDTSGEITMREVYNFCSGTSSDHLAVYFKPKFYRTIKDFIDNHNNDVKSFKEEKLLYVRN